MPNIYCTLYNSVGTSELSRGGGTSRLSASLLAQFPSRSTWKYTEKKYFYLKIKSKKVQHYETYSQNRKKYRYYGEHFVSWDVLFLVTFCPLVCMSLGAFCLWDILSLGHVVLRTLCLRTFCLGTFCLCTENTGTGIYLKCTVTLYFWHQIKVPVLVFSNDHFTV